MTDPIKPNLIKPRWSKVLSDIWDDKTRTVLVVSSIAVGVFAIGMIISAYVILREDINLSYASVNPRNIEVWTAPFYEDFERILEKVPGVEDVEGRFELGIRARKGDDNWQGLTLVGIPDFDHQINKLVLIDGVTTPGRDELILSQDFMHATGFLVGDVIEIELPNGTNHFLTIVGLVTDQTMSDPDPAAVSKASVTMRTLRAIGLGDQFNHLYLTVEGDGSDAAVIGEIASDVEDKFERNGQPVFRVEESLTTEHPMGDSILAIIGILGALGGLITILSSSLIINTLNALLTQQLRQIGVMKLIGGRSQQILGMYIVLIVAYSLIALVLAVPLGTMAGYGLASLIAYLTGAVLQGFRVIPLAVFAQTLIAIIIPLGAGFVPINRGAKTNVRRAISNYRPGARTKKRAWLKWVPDLNFSWFSGLSRPILLSFRNTFRKTDRLLLTIFTLTVAGAVFIAVFNVRDSMTNVMEQVMQHFMGDVTVNFTHPYPLSTVERGLMNVPGVSGVEGWSGAMTDLWDEEDDVVTTLAISAPPQSTQLLDLEYVDGRWLLPGEQNAMVVSDTIYKYYPELEVGDTLLVKIPGIREEPWVVVGVFRFVEMLGDPMAYANFEFVSAEINQANQASSYRIITDAHGTDAQQALTKDIDQYLQDRGFSVLSVQAGYVLRESASLAVNTLVIFLLLMAVLTAFVGSIGLTGTMSINVLERTREIGVMRTIGAVDIVIMQSVIIEALVIGIITWALAIVVSFPISSALLAIVGEAMMGSGLAMSFTPIGILLWLGIVIVLSTVASIMPARNAARLTINEVLAYE